jgi:GT2 family glycosyltransferase
MTPILILNWNGWRQTFECIRSLRAAPNAEEIWLIDNGSLEDVSQEAKSIGPNIRVERWDDNYGWAGGYNRALKLAIDEGYEFVYLINNDCIVDKHFLTHVLDTAATDSKIAAVGSRIAYIDPPNFLQFDGEYYRPGEQKLRRSKRIKDVRAVVGAGMLVRLAAVKDCGYFNDLFFLYHEESEWCGRVGARGWRLVVSDASIVKHRDKGSNQSADWQYYAARNRFLLINHFPQLYPRLPIMSLVDATSFVMHEALEKGEVARRHSDYTTWSAIASGLIDGLDGRFGKRPSNPAHSLPDLLKRWEELLQTDQLGNKLPKPAAKIK